MKLHFVVDDKANPIFLLLKHNGMTFVDGGGTETIVAHYLLQSAVGKSPPPLLAPFSDHGRAHAARDDEHKRNYANAFPR